MTEVDLLGLGFRRSDDGTLLAAANIGLTSIDAERFFQVAISLPGGIVTFVVPGVALRGTAFSDSTAR
jgi:hypothetical protein